DVLREVAGAKRRAHGRDGLPGFLLRRVLVRLVLRPAPRVVRGQVIGAAVLAVFLREDRRERLPGHVRVEEVPETVAATVLHRRVVRVAGRPHADEATFLRDTPL